MTEEKAKSKKELKRLAKKAAKGSQKQPQSIASPQSSDNVPPPVTLPTEARYFLANASKDCNASLKAAIASIAFNVKLSRPPLSCTNTLPKFFNGPTLVTNSGSAVSFGGNGIAKALSLLSSEAKDTVLVEEFLELERTSLRDSCSKKSKKAALALVEKTLSNGSYLVGDSLTIADIVVVVTLSKEKMDSAIIQSYLDLHTSSSTFKLGSQLRDSLVPPPPIDFDSNNSLMAAVNSIFYEAISSVVPLGVDFPDTIVEKSKQIQFGDYQCKEAMPLFSQIKSANLSLGIQSAVQLAEAIVKSIPEDNPVVDTLQVNGPGFILCKVKVPFLQKHLNQMMNSGEAGVEPKVPVTANLSKEDDIVVVDFSSPNIAKEMHVGHLRSTIIGESVCRILEFCGSDVKRVNHVGDWGTQFGMLITYLKEACPDFSAQSKASDVDIGNLTQFYKKAKARFDEDADFKKTSQLNVVKLQAGDEECRAIWNTLCDISRKDFEKVYKRLDVTLEECGESFYNKKIPAVIEEFNNAGHLSVEDGGAKCVFVSNYKNPLMLQKSDGGFGYDSTDMAALKYRLQNLGACRIVYITDFSQGDHFNMCFEAAEIIGWRGAEKHKLEHIGFGTVMGLDGKRFKTRSGETVRLVDLLDEAVSRMEKSLHQRIEDEKANITSDQVPEVAAAMGYGAVKYFDLRRNPKSNYGFSYDQMLDTKGNTAIYLLYAHARLESICTKGKIKHQIDVDELIKSKSASIVLGHASERNLAFHMLMFADMIEEVLKDLYPYRVCDFLYALANAVSEFITNCKVLDSPEMQSRLLLCRASAIVMRQCFDLLGIRHVKSI